MSAGKQPDHYRRWQLLSDQDREEPKIDPRWEKLNDFKLDDD